MDIKKEIIFSGGGKIRDVLNLIAEEKFETFEELRFRASKPSFARVGGEQFFIGNSGDITKSPNNAFIAEIKDIADFIRVLSGYSLYAFEEEIKKGYITIEGGHRIGICGRASVKDEKIESLSNFSAINIRISHEIKGCGEKIIPYISENKKAFNTIIVSPPGTGKTTLLRDIIRILSNKGNNISVVDERGEIAASWRGKCCNDVGIRTDVLDGCPKKDGMLMLLRSMSPDIIAVDELGGYDELKAVETILFSGVTFICTVHGNDISDALKRTGIEKSICAEYFKRFIELRRTEGEITAFIKDGMGNILGKEAI